jgi:hypothetical protein
MLIEVPETQPEFKPVKEMLGISRTNTGDLVVRINSSSLDLIQTCGRKAMFAIENGYRKEDEEKEALVFGRSMHKALEVFYTVPVEKRDDTVFTRMVEAFQKSGASLPKDEDARSVDNGVKILSKYWETYRNDEWVIFEDTKGPFVERQVSHRLSTMTVGPKQETVHIVLFGTIDAMLKNTVSGELVVADHKTTKTLGQEFFSKLKPNHQFTGYLWLVREALKLKAERFMVNGIQVAKTKSDMVRAFTSRTEEDFDEFRAQVEFSVNEYLHGVNYGQWRMGPLSACTLYGGCQYREACAAPKSQREFILQSQYPDAIKRT